MYVFGCCLCLSYLEYWCIHSLYYVCRGPVVLFYFQVHSFLLGVLCTSIFFRGRRGHCIIELFFFGSKRTVTLSDIFDLDVLTLLVVTCMNGFLHGPKTVYKAISGIEIESWLVHVDGRLFQNFVDLGRREIGGSLKHEQGQRGNIGSGCRGSTKASSSKLGTTVERNRVLSKEAVQRTVWQIHGISKEDRKR